ncbi:hypothetical protein CLV91_0704 [Maribacter vaceletii]|uniref:Uncharacterized protein n=1 Tax=Maribacter vaceletii TaxID=1206816 RepID=A0A495ECU9_9FLAO|nr:hypothetical protein CLV91_0704 [Maribacter vaceletii]
MFIFLLSLLFFAALVDDEDKKLPLQNNVVGVIEFKK